MGNRFSEIDNRDTAANEKLKESDQDNSPKRRSTLKKLNSEIESRKNNFVQESPPREKKKTGPKKRLAPTKPVTFYIPIQDKEEIEEISDSLSGFIRDAIREKLDRENDK